MDYLRLFKRVLVYLLAYSFMYFIVAFIGDDWRFTKLLSSSFGRYMLVMGFIWASILPYIVVVYYLED